jgi:ribosomal protein L40E
VEGDQREHEPPAALTQRRPRRRQRRSGRSGSGSYGCPSWCPERSVRCRSCAAVLTPDAGSCRQCELPRRRLAASETGVRTDGYSRSQPGRSSTYPRPAWFLSIGRCRCPCHVLHDGPSLVDDHSSVSPSPRHVCAWSGRGSPGRVMLLLGRV